MRERMTNEPDRSDSQRSSRGAYRHSFASLAATLTGLAPSIGPTRLVAIDGPGGSGKSTFASRLADALGGCPVVHTDDFANWEHQFDWWPALLNQVLRPMTSGRPGRYRRYDWVARAFAEWHDVPCAPVVVLEGVGAARREFAPYLAFAVWIETPADVRLARGIARDGEELRGFWEMWRRGEQAHYAIDDARDRADLIVDGDPATPHDPAREFVVLPQG